MKRLPSARLPLRAAKRYPGFTSRESALSPRMSVSRADAGMRGAVPPSMSSVRRKFPPRWCRQSHHQRTANFGRIFVNRLDSDQRSHPLDRARDARRRDPSAGGIAESLLVAMRLVDRDHDEVSRIIHRKNAGEGRHQRVAGIAVPDHFLGGAGLAADEIAGRFGELARALLDDESQE